MIFYSMNLSFIIFLDNGGKDDRTFSHTLQQRDETTFLHNRVNPAPLDTRDASGHSIGQGCGTEVFLWPK
jgi:hypothetical protein